MTTTNMFLNFGGKWDRPPSSQQRTLELPLLPKTQILYEPLHTHTFKHILIPQMAFMKLTSFNIIAPPPPPPPLKFQIPPVPFPPGQFFYETLICICIGLTLRPRYLWYL